MRVISKFRPTRTQSDTQRRHAVTYVRDVSTAWSRPSSSPSCVSRTRRARAAEAVGAGGSLPSSPAPASSLSLPLSAHSLSDAALSTGSGLTDAAPTAPRPPLQGSVEGVEAASGWASQQKEVDHTETIQDTSNNQHAPAQLYAPALFQTHTHLPCCSNLQPVSATHLYQAHGQPKHAVPCPHVVLLFCIDHPPFSHTHVYSKLLPWCTRVDMRFLACSLAPSNSVTHQQGTLGMPASLDQLGCVGREIERKPALLHPRQAR